MKTVLTLPMPPSTNHLFSGGAGHGRRYVSKEYEAWREHAGIELKRQRPLPVKGMVILFFEFQEKDRRKRDVTNFLKAPEDLLVHFGIIEADDCSIVREVRAKWSAEVEGCRITIQDFASTLFKERAA
jgi:crossover junction endodeoxyribonuclease RusA